MVLALIPVYTPSEQLVCLVRELAVRDFGAVIVVNDGSAQEGDHFFREIVEIAKVRLLRHAANLGKGAALKTGLNHVYRNFADATGVVVVDADGQHLPADAARLARILEKHRESLVIGVRAFDGSTPLRCRFGNAFTRTVFRMLTGEKLSDTQSGLRGIPQSMIPMLLKLSANGYQFEQDMLLACKYTGRQIIEEPVSTIYLEGNKSSHFNPIIDSMKIYFVLFRFTLAALLSVAIDCTVFIFAFKLSACIAASQTTARLVSMGFTYSLVQGAVFYSGQKTATTFPKYLALVLVSGLVSYLLIVGLLRFLHVPVIGAKILAESVVLLANFTIQRDFIFVAQNVETGA